MSDQRLVEPLVGPVHATVTLPGSKSITNRALLCAALAEGTSRLSGVLVADDTAAMVGALGRLGAVVERRSDDVVEVVGVAGRFRTSGAAAVDARLSGTTSRFLLPAALVADGPVTVDGAPPLRARPMADGLAALVALGADVSAEGDRLPATVRVGAGARIGRSVTVSAAASSQFVSGLLLVAPCLAEGLELRLEGVVRSAPYLAMTIAVMRSFGASVEVDPEGRTYRVAPGGYRGTAHRVEPDASAASYFFAAAAVCGGEVRVEGLGTDSLQGDLGFVDVLARMGATVERGARETIVRSDGHLRGVTVDMADISDTAQTLAAIAPFADGVSRIEGIGFIRAKETDRIGAVVAELRRCGIDAVELDDGIEVHPGTPHAAVVRTYDDHRMAMSFAVMGLRAPGITIDDPGCVAKTFPGFWDALEQLRRTT